jgi:hypothetical protein
MLDAPKITSAPESMTLRDYIAIAILQAWSTNNNDKKLHNVPDIFESAYWVADGMLKVRNKLGGKK